MRRPHDGRRLRCEFRGAGFPYFRSLHPPAVSLMNANYVPVILLRHVSGLFRKRLITNGLLRSGSAQPVASPIFLPVAPTKLSFKGMPRPHNANLHQRTARMDQAGGAGGLGPRNPVA